MSIMQRSKIARHPFDGESSLLTGTRDVLGDRYRREIEANYRWVLRQHELATSKILAPGFAQEDSAWVDQAACRAATDPEVFFPVTDEAKAARAWEPYCSSCPVLEECGAYAKRLDLVGIWGGEARGINLTSRGRPRRAFYEPGSAAERKHFRDRARHAKAST